MNIKETVVIIAYLWMPLIKKIMEEARDLNKILNHNEKKISLKYCIKNNYIEKIM